MSNKEGIVKVILDVKEAVWLPNVSFDILYITTTPYFVFTGSLLGLCVTITPTAVSLLSSGRLLCYQN